MQKTENENVNEKAFLDELKSIFRNYLRLIIWRKDEK